MVRSLKEWWDLPTRERAAWTGHFDRSPPGDILTHRLIAELIASVYNVVGNKTQGRDFAPWAFPPPESRSEEVVNSQEKQRERVSGENFAQTLEGRWMEQLIVAQETKGKAVDG